MRRRNKFGARKVRAGGYVFDSQLEYARWLDLCLLQEQGLIRDLKPHPEFEMFPGVWYTESGRDKPRKHSHVTYKADFRYFDVELGEQVVEDVKSAPTAKTALFRLKLRWFLWRYPNQLFLLTTRDSATYYRGLPEKDT